MTKSTTNAASTCVRHCAVLALALLAPQAMAGYYARTQALAVVLTAPSFSEVQPWAGTVTDGFGFTTTSPNLFASASNLGGTLNGKTVSSAAIADLSTGSLGVRATVVNTQATANFSGSAPAVAAFGDSFSIRSSTGGAFAWNGASAAFNIELEGSSFNTTSTRMLDWTLTLNVYSAGTLNLPSSAWQAASLGIAEWTGNRLSNGNATTSAGSDPGSINLQAGFGGSLAASNLQLGASFAPNGDFDWSLSLITFAGGLTTQLGTHDADFLNTATLAFAAPQGAQTFSSSGVFPGTSPIPETSTQATLALGLVLIELLRRVRRGSATLRAQGHA